MRIITLFTFIFMSCANVFSVDKFELVAEIRIPSLMTSAQNLTLLSDNILPGTSGIIGVAVASLAFDPKLAGFDLTSPIQVLGFGSKSANPKEFQWCLVMSPKNTDSPATQINDKKRTVFVKGIGNRSVLSYNKALIDSISEIPPVENGNDEYDVKMVLYPRKFLDLFPEGLASVKKDITELVLKKSGRDEEDLNKIKILSIKMTELEKAAGQFSKADLNISFRKDKISINSEFCPVDGSSAERLIKAQTKTSNAADPCDIGTGALISYGRINITDQLKNEIIETLRKILIESTDDYNPEVTDFFSELTASFSGDFRFRMDSFDPESVCILETSVSGGKYQPLKNFITGSKTIKEVKNGIYSFKPENVNKDKYNSFINLNEKCLRMVYGKCSMPSIEKVITDGIPADLKKQSNADIRLYAFSNEDNGARNPLFSSFFIFNEKTLTINTDVFEECIKKAIPANLIPKKTQGNLKIE